MTSQANRHAPPPIPNGWFAVSWSKDLAHGEVKRIRYFDEDLVLFRTRSGRPVVLDAYCAHLGPYANAPCGWSTGWHHRSGHLLLALNLTPESGHKHATPYKASSPN